MKYRVVKSNRPTGGWHVQRKVFRVWVTIAMSGRLEVAVKHCALASIGQTGAVDSLASVFSLTQLRFWNVLTDMLAITEAWCQAARPVAIPVRG